MSRLVQISLSCAGAALLGALSAGAAEYPVGNPHIVFWNRPARAGTNRRPMNNRYPGRWHGRARW